MGIDPDTGDYGYYKVGADSVTPFSGGSGAQAVLLCQLNNCTLFDSNGYSCNSDFAVATAESDVFGAVQRYFVEDGHYIGYVDVTFKRDGYYTWSNAGSTSTTYRTAGSTATATIYYQYFGNMYYGLSVVYHGESNPTE